MLVYPDQPTIAWPNSWMIHRKSLRMLLNVLLKFSPDSHQTDQSG